MSLFFYVGMFVWNFVMIFIGYSTIQTPMDFSPPTWSYISVSIYPWMVTLGATMLNIFYLIGFIRQNTNLRQNFTAEILVECCIKAVLGNVLLVSGLSIMQTIFEIASLMSKEIMSGPLFVITQDDNSDLQLFYMFFGIIFLSVCLVCSVTILLVVYGRHLQLYMLVVLAPAAFATLPGGHGISQTASAWIRTFLGKTFSIVAISLAIVIASNICNNLNLGVLADMVDIDNSTIQAIHNMLTMVLLTSSVKGVDSLIRRAFAL